MHRSSAENLNSPVSANTGEAAAVSADTLRIHEGDCWVFVAFDAGNSIDLDMAEKSLSAAPAADDEAAHREELSHRRRAPRYLQFRPSPVRIDQSAPELSALDLAGFCISPRVECTLFDFGAVSVAYRIPIDRGDPGLPLEGLVPLAQALSENMTLRHDAKRRVEGLSRRLSSAIERPGSVDLFEDYTVYHARRWSPASPAHTAVASARESIARLLLAEPDRLSQQAVDSALSECLSYGPGDIAIVDWNAAMLLDARAEDTLAVLEFANVELLEMRFLDDRLDSILDRSYASLLQRDSSQGLLRSPLRPLLGPHRVDRRRLAALQMDSAMMFEGINNALKLIGDQHLARLYALAARRFHLADWDQSILRKLHTVDGLYQKLGDEQAARRMEVLEWIIIILIAVSIVLPFILTGAK